MNEKAALLLKSALSRHLNEEQMSWLNDRMDLLREANSDRELHITLGMIPRKLGRSDLDLNDGELDQADAARSGWYPIDWSVETAARVFVLLHRAQRGSNAFGELFKDLCRTAELSESMTLFRGIAVFPDSDMLDNQIAEGLRTNMRAVFEAIAHNNPYPAEKFDDNRWNHMVLKALFIDSTLHTIQGLDKRANAELAGILCDYAHERWAAGRSVTPELWRCVGPYAKGSMLEDLKKVLLTGDKINKHAALLALISCPDPVAIQMTKDYPIESAAIIRGDLTWDTLQR